MKHGDYCNLCGAPRKPTQAPVHVFRNSVGAEFIRIRRFRPKIGKAMIEESPDLMLSISLYRNGGGLPGEHICDDCIIIGLRHAKRFVDETLTALGSPLEPIGDAPQECEIS